jgi:hypothetical protein
MASRQVEVDVSRLSGPFLNLDLMAKVIDHGTRVDFFWGTLSDLEYTLTVTDTRSGESRVYRNSAGTFCGGLDDSVFPR